MDEKSQKQFTSKAYIAQEHIEVILNYKVSTYFFLNETNENSKIYFKSNLDFR